MKKLIYPEEKVFRELPNNVKPSDSALFAPSQRGMRKATFIQRLENVCVNRELLLFSGRKILAESFTGPFFENIQKQAWNYAKFIIKNHLFRKKVTFTEKALWVWDNFSTGGYYHWLTEILPRIWLAREYLPQTTLLIPDYFYQNLPFVPAMLKAMRLESIRFINSSEVIETKDLIVPDRIGGLNEFHAEPIKEIVDVFFKYFYKENFITNKKRFFISRAKAKNRNILNESEVLAVFRRFGFEIIHLEEYAWKDQISLLAGAEAIAGLHGAGLANMIFLNPQSKVIELRSHCTELPDYTKDFLNCFYKLARVCDLKYYYIATDQLSRNSASEQRIEDYSMHFDPIIMQDELAKIIND